VPLPDAVVPVGPHAEVRRRVSPFLGFLVNRRTRIVATHSVQVPDSYQYTVTGVNSYLGLVRNGFSFTRTVRSERMAEPRPKRERAAATGPGEGMHEDAASSRIEVSQVKTVRFKAGVSARAMLHQIQLVPDPRGRLKLLLQAMEVHAKKMSVLNAESAFGKMLALNLCGDEEKFQDDQIQQRLKTLQEEYDFFVMEQVQQRRAHFPGNEAKTFHSMWSQEEAAPAAELGLGLGYYPSAKKQRGEGSLRD